VLLPDEHAWTGTDGERGEAARAATGRDDVRAEMAQGPQAVAVAQCGEASEPARRHVREKHPLDRILVAEGEDLLEVGALDQPQRLAPATPAWRLI
jgi:hypothetical protein